jgi:hypothetical protein
MSALGQKQTSPYIRVMSALPPEADIGTQQRDVRFVPKADSCGAAKSGLFDHLAGFGEQRRWHRQSERHISGHFNSGHFNAAGRHPV